MKRMNWIGNVILMNWAVEQSAETQKIMTKPYFYKLILDQLFKKSAFIMSSFQK